MGSEERIFFCFPLESLKNIHEPPQMFVVKYEEWVEGNGIWVCVCPLLNLNSIQWGFFRAELCGSARL